MSHRISKGGSFRIDRRFRGVGRIALASGTTSKQTLAKLNNLLTELYEDGRLEILRGIRDRQWTIQEVLQAKRSGHLPYLASELILNRRLWETVWDWVPRSAAAKGTRQRYRVSFKALERSRVLAPGASVADLKRVDWAVVHRGWKGGPADWNRLRSAVSRFLSMTLRDKYHPVRREIMARFPRAQESTGRVPDISPELFWDVVNRTPEYLRPSYVTLAATGLRVGEYLAMQEHHLQPFTQSVLVPGTKTAGSEDVMRIGDAVWPWVRAAIPSPVRYKCLYTHWKSACKDAGAPNLTLHDLRHFYGQILTDAGRPEVSVQHGLRHADARMTRRYTRQRDRGENARLMDTILFPEQPKEDAQEA